MKKPKKGDMVPLSRLCKGDMFWLLYRGFIVSKVFDNGNRLCECLDDGGKPTLAGTWTVEVVSIAEVAPVMRSRRGKRS